MFATLLAVLVSQAAGIGEPDIVQLNGRCRYPEAASEYRDQTVLAICDTLSINRSDVSATLDFGQRSWGSMMQFSGAMAGDRMVVSRLTLRSGKSVGASGNCEIFYTSGAVSVVSCVARVRSQTYAANFVASRL